MEDNDKEYQFETPTDKIIDKFELRKYLYYFIIGVLSFTCCAFLPMVGSTADLGWNFPNTPAGIAIWIMTKVLIAIVNILLFYCFMEQAKLNVKDNEYYKKANEILNNIKHKKRIPRGPKQWQNQQYGTKGVFIFITSVLSAITLTQALLTFDWIALLTYLFTIIMGVIFGILQMKNAECYWTNEYYQYAIMMQEQDKKGEEKQCSNMKEKNSETCKSKSRKTRKTLNTLPQKKVS